ncbi:MAG: MerR family transcriptional regulator [Gammaproteobacteria bacterium]|jgi:DNA-binding transcriptional MerR regulator|nr:MerR family transcriptional regulator [Gammaproteobacteria bacterium]MDH3846702.1 MerR family transcriptional regulator [Gammaproteobacteria bacterium]MDH3862974.1 MerR family transcriptional regulator [Gammaproteobacteria bacterium]MDH3904319.1 MerR family transcriptional regulator [Gammaproteobacteria bacterium]MDH4003773.1 MerR family transcriptional regulator [Gammaproteobacteria bacterium]
MEETTESQLFKIGAVARLTGVSVHTLRKWEERHDAVRPRRSKGGKRLYDEAEVQRLVLIKKLVDHGVSLPSIATCSFDELADRWATLSGAEAPPVMAIPTRVAILGSGFAAWLNPQLDPLRGLELVAAADEAADLRRRVGDAAVDVLLVECPVIAAGTPQEVRDVMQQLGAAGAVAVYWFGNKQHVEALQSWRIEVLRAPVDLVALKQAIARLHGVQNAPLPTAGNRTVAFPSDRSAPAPRLSREALATIALANTAGDCGCQKNLVDVVLSLRALEKYLSGCESRTPEDEALHRALYQKVGEARSNIEDAIEHFVAVEGIEI